MTNGVEGVWLGEGWEGGMFIQIVLDISTPCNQIRLSQEFRLTSQPPPPPSAVDAMKRVRVLPLLTIILYSMFLNIPFVESMTKYM